MPPAQTRRRIGRRYLDLHVFQWRRAAGLPEGLSVHSMRKAATHWWLRNHRDLVANNFSLKTIFGWATDKELDRYTRDYAREEEAKECSSSSASGRAAR